MKSLVPNKIIINGIIVFTPAKRELCNYLTGESVTLHTPANYCFLHLLTNHPKILQKAELIQLSWNNSRQVISDNTFYQMVFNLRHNLEKVGGEDIVVTVPRRGLQIKPGTTVNSINNEIEAQSKKNTYIKNSAAYRLGKLTLNHKHEILVLVLSGILFFLGYILLAFHPDNNVFDDYVHHEYNMCSVKFNKNINKENIKAILEESHIDCSHKKDVILSQSKNSSRLSVILCTDVSRTEKECQLSLFVQRV